MKVFQVAFAAALTAGVLAGSSASATVMPGWAGLPDPMTDTACWIQDGSKLVFSTAACGADNKYRSFSVPINGFAYADSTVITVRWNVGFSCPTCTIGGEMRARGITYDENGAMVGLGTWDYNSGKREQTLAYAQGGAVMLQIHARGSINAHWLNDVSASSPTPPPTN